MKTIPIIVFVLCLALGGCLNKTKQETANYNISNYIKERLDNPNTYEPVDFSPVIESTYADEYQYAIDHCNDEIRRHTENLSQEYNSEVAKKLYAEWINTETKKRDSILKLTGTHLDSLIYERTVYHKYRSSNKFNAIITQSALAYLDSNMRVIKCVNF